MELNLDDGSTTKLKQFDVVIQRATNHEWVCLDEKPALACAVLESIHPLLVMKVMGNYLQKIKMKGRTKVIIIILRVVCNI